MPLCWESTGCPLNAYEKIQARYCSFQSPPPSSPTYPSHLTSPRFSLSLAQPFSHTSLLLQVPFLIASASSQVLFLLPRNTSSSLHLTNFWTAFSSQRVTFSEDFRLQFWGVILCPHEFYPSATASCSTVCFSSYFYHNLWLFVYFLPRGRELKALKHFLHYSIPGTVYVCE